MNQLEPGAPPDGQFLKQTDDGRISLATYSARVVTLALYSDPINSKHHPRLQNSAVPLSAEAV
jgi:hypothetical protein